MKTVGTILFLLSVIISEGQLYDAQWVIGDVHPSLFDFRVDTVKIDTIPGTRGIFLTNANICDENGSFLYFTNGINIIGKNYDTLINGNGLNPCQYTAEKINDGLNIPQAALFIPHPNNTRYYDLFHFSNDVYQSSRPSILYHSIINKDADNGFGAVVKKNVAIANNNLLREGGMTACKHANGRDYWLIIAASRINRFYKFLISPDTITGPYIQDIGPQFPLPYDVCYSKFSQDGTKFATGTYQSLLLVMDFDRCTGEFNNPLTLFNNSSVDSSQPISGCGGLEFSPNNRFLYASAGLGLNQFDLSSSNPQDSINIYSFSDTDYSKIEMLQIAPNGKIYGANHNGGYYYLHQINSPDSFGLSCNFKNVGQRSYCANNINLPNMINYKLGPLVGSGCDTITTGFVPIVPSNTVLRVIPNPADKYAYVEMGMRGNYEFDLLNASGQIVAMKHTKQVDIFDTESLSADTYFLRVMDGAGNIAATSKLVITH